MSDEELEAIRQRKLQQRLQQMQQSAAEEQQKQEMERARRAQIDAILRQILTPEARSRLEALRLVKPQFAEQVEIQLIQLAQSGRLGGIITDNQLKALLLQVQKNIREPKIKFR